MVKRFIICCDGTWNSSDAGKEGIPSNVALLSRMIARQGYRKGYSKEAREELKRSGASEDELAVWDINATIEQVVYYQTGVGTGPSNGMIAKAETFVEGATGSGLEEHVLQAYHFIATNYQSGDEVLLFGFSRGAYTARAVGGLLTQMGILQPLDLKHFNDLYRSYKEQGDGLAYSPCDIKGNRWGKHVTAEKVAEKEAKAKEDAIKMAMSTSYEGHDPEVVWDHGPHWHEHVKVDPETELEKEAKKDGCLYWTPCIPPSAKNSEKGEPAGNIVLEEKPTKIYLEVIGVWDTVGALGVPENQLTKFFNLNKGKDFADTKLNKYMRRAYQALALDEHRGAFTPSLWYIQDAEKASADLSLEVDLRQCWFPGYHADIGGGSEMDKNFVEDEFAHRVDQLSLAWMCDQVEREQCLTFEKDVAYAFIPTAHADENWNWKVKVSSDPCGSFYATPVGGGSVYRCPGTYNRTTLEIKSQAATSSSKNEKEIEKVAPKQYTREKMHPSIHLLMEATKLAKSPYKPAALGKSPIQRFAGWGGKLMKQMPITLPEWTYVPQMEGMGAKWTRPVIPAEKAGWGPFSFIWPGAVGNNSVEINEHVIMSTEDDRYHNFEARLLTEIIQKNLDKQNKILRETFEEAWQRKIYKTTGEAASNVVIGPHACHADWWFGNGEDHQKVHHEHDEREKVDMLKAGVIVEVAEIGLDSDSE